MFWDEWLQHLKQLPPDSAEWEGAEAFMGRIEALRSEQQREARSRLVAAWTAMATECSEDLRFFEAADIGAIAVAAATSVGTLASIERLREGILQLRQIRQLPKAVYSEAKARRVELERQENVVSTLIQEIRAGLMREQSGDVQGLQGLVVPEAPSARGIDSVVRESHSQSLPVTDAIESTTRDLGSKNVRAASMPAGANEWSPSTSPSETDVPRMNSVDAPSLRSSTEPVSTVEVVAGSRERAASNGTGSPRSKEQRNQPSAPPTSVVAGSSFEKSKNDQLKRGRRRRGKQLRSLKAKHQAQHDQTSSDFFHPTSTMPMADVFADETVSERAQLLGLEIASSVFTTLEPDVIPPPPPPSELKLNAISDTSSTSFSRTSCAEAPPTEATEELPETTPATASPIASVDSRATESAPAAVPTLVRAPLPHLIPQDDEATVSREAPAGSLEECDPLPSIATESAVSEHARGNVAWLSQWLREADYAAAYWWLRSRDAEGVACPLPAWLLAAILAATRLNQENILAVSDELGPLATENLPPEDDAAQLLAIAAALMPALTQSRIDVKHWLEGVPKALPKVRELVTAVHRFAEHGHPLRAEDIGSRRSVEQSDEKTKQIAAEMSDWLESAAHRKANYQRASQVWRHLIKTGNGLGEWLTLVAKDSREKVSIASVCEAIEIWSERSHIVRRVHYWDGQFTKGRKDPIVGPALEQLVAWTLEACDKANHWVAAVRSPERKNAKGGWFEEQVDELQHRLSETTSGAFHELRALASKDESLLAAAAQVACRSVRDLSIYFGLNELPVLYAPTQSGEVPFADIRGTPNTASSLTHRLLWLPEIDLLDDGQPSDEALPKVADALEAAACEQRSLRSAFEHWLERRDFRFTKLMFESADITDTEESLWQLRNDRLESAQEELKSRVRLLENQIQFSVVDGVLNEETRAKCQQDLAELRPDDCLDFPAAGRVCDVAERTLQDARHVHCQAQRETWNSRSDSLLKAQPMELRDQIARRIEDALDRRDCRVVHEYLSRLESAVFDHVPFVLDDPLRETADDLDFISRHDQILSAVQQIRSGKLDSHSAILSAELSTTHVESANQVWDAWRRLAQRSVSSIDAPTRSYIARLCDFLGLELFESDGTSAMELVAKDKAWAHLRIDASDRQSSPTPQFGSDRQNSYDVLCLWGEASFSPPALAARVRETKLDHRPILVWCFGGLSLSHRVNLGRALSKEKLTVLVLDDVLLGWLLRQRENRWSLWQRAALPFSAVNPYKPSGVIPREIFFGRETMLQSILDFTGSGSCLVYGGRQLGKSSLLRRAQKDFHNPAGKQFAISEEIRHLGDPLTDSPASLIWAVLRDELNRGFFHSKVTTDRPHSLVRHIRDRLEQDPNTKLLVLLDEADNFLDHDAAKSFEYVSILKNLVEQSERRVKVVFAGTKNVQRFHGVPNQPLANLGTTLEIGPLEPLAAMRLVREPLRDAGFIFDDESLILKILSYTNYHPALIQYVCFHLLAALHEHPRLSPPPSKVADATVQQVCARRETQKYIRDRFDLTLQLDERFRAIVRTIMDEQIGGLGAQAQVYSAVELLDRVRIWWPAAFQPMVFERFRDLLDELCGLGVLLRVAGGYRFRSPNVMHLIGDVEEIRGYLEGLDQRRPPSVFRSDSHRKLLGKTARRSPLTIAQGRQLGKREFGTGLIFGSRALGWDDLEVAASQLLSGVSSKDEALEVVEAGPASIVDWESRLRSFLEFHEHPQQLILLAAVSGNGIQLESIVRQSMEFCRRREKSEKRWLRVLLRFDPIATWTWQMLPPATRLEFENSSLAHERLVKWDVAALDLHLEWAEKLRSDSIIEHLMHVSGGWPMLIDEVFRRCGDKVDPRDSASEVEREMKCDSTLRRLFLQGLGMDLLPQSESVRRTLGSIGESPFEMELWPEILAENGVTKATSSDLLDFLRLMQVIECDGLTLHVNPQVARAIAEP